MTESEFLRTETRNEGLRERKRFETRRAIHEACLDLAEENGFSGFTVDEAAARAGISRRTFFNYFANKEDAIFDIESEDVREIYRERYLAGDYHSTDSSVVGEIIRMYADIERTRLDGYRPSHMRRVRGILTENPKLIDHFIKKAEANFQERSEILKQRHPHLSSEERMIALKTVETVRHLYIEHLGESTTYGPERLIKTYDDVARIGFSPVTDASSTTLQETN
ncbi:TetR/AcrR family transcriptional regulator [Rothia uropygialis]|uniref:TetR/AcrR family transcriptional regulator n=1 Tax=Kocuria sp. 36 TaxID=1415402 RepID=UPI001EE855C5|nr:TetR/AcrR family transcriptional regulator [Kocuria sp. 36]